MALRLQARPDDGDEEEGALAELEAMEEAARVDAPEPELRLPPAPRPAVYRDVDPTIKREREQHAADTAAADLAIETAIQESRQAARAAERARTLGAVLRASLLVSLLAGMNALAWVLGSPRLLFFTLPLTALGWLIVSLSIRIKPTDDPPPPLPPYGGGRGF
jgi:hypothetical protein